MNDENQNPQTPPREPPRDPRPTDIEYFLMVLPVIAGPLVSKSADSTSGASMAIATARELCGQLVTMGFLKAVGVLPNGQPLSIGAAVQPSNGSTVGAPVPAHDGRMIKQFPMSGAVVHPGQ